MPEKELTPEELEKEEKSRIKRAKNREAAYKYQKRMRSKIYEQRDQQFRSVFLKHCLFLMVV